MLLHTKIMIIATAQKMMFSIKDFFSKCDQIENCRFGHIYWRNPFRKTSFLLCNFIEIALRHGNSPVNSLHIFGTPFPRKTSGWLLLNRIFLRISVMSLAIAEHYYCKFLSKIINEVNALIKIIRYECLKVKTKYSTADGFK